jgi:predicted nuclease of restriction endonuclease-like (RecB) superfamily
MSKKDERKAMGGKKPGAMIPVSGSHAEMPKGYAGFLATLKERITGERIKAVLSANAAMVLLYWDIGRSILERQRQEGWGAKVIDRLSGDLKTAFPDMSGLSPRNLKYMRKFAEAWPDRGIVQRTVAQIPWRSNLALLDKLHVPELRLWYAKKTLEFGLGRDMLVVQIETRLHEREGKALNNAMNWWLRTTASALTRNIRSGFSGSSSGFTAGRSTKDPGSASPSAKRSSSATGGPLPRTARRGREPRWS